MGAGLCRMEADAAFLVEGLGKLTGDDLPSPVYDLLTLARAKAVPKKTTQMSASINNFLRRDNRQKVTEATPVVLAESEELSDARSEVSALEPDSSQTEHFNDENVPVGDSGSSQHPEGSVPDQPEERTGSSSLPVPPAVGQPSIENHTSGGAGDADYFSVLGVSPSANEQEIKRAYRKLMVQVSTTWCTR
jgi:DnaJ-domain-containing protein 1